MAKGKKPTPSDPFFVRVAELTDLGWREDEAWNETQARVRAEEARLEPQDESQPPSENGEGRSPGPAARSRPVP
ncbi:hypothetical protein DFP74_4018 [Nocardiopsis sp. Huas11]|uniref:hypothetical protein n=1 Tax=Nocardiopsis sp. Huas11 TaxID=2183912 RepID=UPI000EAC5C9F|nr:hypothetical protein [Nocardiopsis sp. Huas11]RKS08322.1 hypothetical protein DFP74_4018 [Nocardiopsis sp. Huas11]